MNFQWDIGLSVLTTYDADGFLGVQIDAYGEQNASVHPYELHHPYGFMGRQLNPVADAAGNLDPSQSTQTLWAYEGSRGHGIALEDPRVVPTLPQIRPGESLWYGAAGQFGRMHADGSITFMTTDQGGSALGRNIFLRLKPTGFTLVAPWGKMTFDATGWHVLTSGGARIDMGSIGGMPAPLDQLSTYIRMRAAMVDIEGGVVNLGPSTGNAQPSALGLQTVAHLAAIATALQAIATALTAASGTTTSGVTPPAAAAVASAVAAASVPAIDILSNTAVG